MSSRRRSSRSIVSGDFSRGEPISRSRRSERLPPAFSILDRQDALQSPYGAPRASVLSSRALTVSRAEPVKTRRFPAQTVTRILRKPDPLSSLRLQGLRHQKFCQDRKRRRQVLFANRVAGRSGGSPGRRGKYTRRDSSQFSCAR